MLPQTVQQRETLSGEAEPPERRGWYAPSSDCTVFRGNYCLRMGMISSRHDVLSRTSRTGGQSNRRWGSKAIRIGHSLEDSSLRTRKTALSAEILLGSPKTSRSISERNSRKIRLRCIFRRTLATGPAWFSPLGFRDNRIANTLFEQLGIVAYLVKEATRQCGRRLASVLPVANSVDSHAKEASKQGLAQAENNTDFLDLLPRVNLGFQVQFDSTYGESAGDSLATPLFEDLVELGQRVHDLRAVSSKLLFSHRILPCVSSSSMSRMIWLIALQSASPRSSFSFFP